MFGKRADLYDLIYDGKDYAGEARQIRDLLETTGLSEGARILEAACGTGTYLEHLDDTYRTTGFDLSPQMIEQAEMKLDDTELSVGDMTAFEVDQPYDALLCLFSSIGYVHGERGLRRTFRNFHDAVAPGGVVVLEPWIGPDDLHVGRTAMTTYRGEDVKLCRQAVTECDGRLAVLEFHWLVAETGGEVDHFTDRHELYLHTHDEYVEAFERAGFAVRHDEEGLSGRGLYLAERQ